MPKTSPRLGAVLAAATGIIGFLLAVVVPMLPVTQTTTEVSWPQNGSLAPVEAPLVAYYPQSMTVEMPCSAASDLRDQGGTGGLVVGTAPTEAGQYAGARGLMVSVIGETVEVRSRNELIAAAPLDEMSDCDAIVVRSDAYETSAEFTGLGVEGRVEDDVRGQVVGVYTDLEGAPPAGADVHIVVDSRYTTSPTALKLTALVLGVAATLASLWFLHRLDQRDGRRHRRVLTRGWWKPRPLDVVVIGTLLLWHVIGANTSDDGYILTQARSIPASGYVPEVFRYYGAPYAPFGMPFYLITWLGELSVGSFWLRLPTLLAGVIAWLLISREVLPRLGLAARTNPAVRWTAAAMFLAFWLTFNNGLRPEPIIAVGVLATWVAMERAIATQRLLPAAVGFIIGGFTLSAAPTGSFCIAVILAAARPLVLLIVRRARRDGWLATLFPPLAAGTLVLFWIFVDQPLVGTLQSSSLLGEVGPKGEWYEEVWRYQSLLAPTADGALARRFAMVAMFLALATCAAVLWRKGRIPGAALGPSRRILGLAVMSIALMAFNPTKWTHHFGAFASIGALLGALVTMAVLPTATRSLRNRILFMAGVLFVLALSFQSTNAWWYVSIYGIPWGGSSPEIFGIVLADVFFFGGVVALLTALLLHLREPFAARRAQAAGRDQTSDDAGPAPTRDGAAAGGSARGPRSLRLAREVWHAPLGVAAGMVVVLIVASMGAAVRNQYPAYSVGLQNLRNLQGEQCGIADHVLAESDPNEGVLTPVGDPPVDSDEFADQLSGGEPPEVYGPDGISGDLTATQTADEEGQTSGAGVSGDRTTTTEGTGGGTTAAEGVNGSHAVLPFGLDRDRVPVLGSRQTGPQLNAETTTSWYPLPEFDDESPLVTVAAAGRFAEGAVTVEWTDEAEPDSDAEALGETTPLDIGPAPSWRNLRVPPGDLPAEARAIRVVAVDTDPSPNRWIAITPPRVPVTQTMHELVGDTRPVLPDWAVAFHVPCVRPFEERAGVHELPEYRIMPERDLAVSSTNTWQGWDGGGPLGFIELTLSGETVPTYLEHDWKRDWGSLIRYTPLVSDVAPAELDHDEVTRSGLWDGGPLAR